MLKGYGYVNFLFILQSKNRQIVSFLFNNYSNIEHKYKKDDEKFVVSFFYCTFASPCGLCLLQGSVKRFNYGDRK